MTHAPSDPVKFTGVNALGQMKAEKIGRLQCVKSLQSAGAAYPGRLKLLLWGSGGKGHGPITQVRGPGSAGGKIKAFADSTSSNSYGFCRGNVGAGDHTVLVFLNPN